MPGNPTLLQGKLVLMALGIGAIAGAGRLAGESGPTPFGGIPHEVPGRIEAEEFDQGGDGVAFHGVGPIFEGHPSWEIPRGRPDAEIAVGRSDLGFGPNLVWMRSGEWMGYTVYAVRSGFYTVLLQTGGAPTYVQDTGHCLNQYQVGQGSVSYHLEVDGLRIHPDLPGNPQVASSRVWLEAGRHQFRLVLDFVSDVSWLDYAPGSHNDVIQYCSFQVDWMEVVESPVLVTPTPVAGGILGLQDGIGTEARFSYQTAVVGQTPEGNLALFDHRNATYRIASPGGEVRSRAGSPGNPSQDGTGAQAGFRNVLHSLISPTGDLFSLEGRPAGGYRIARIDPGGVVTTIYAGIPFAGMGAFVPGWESGMTNVAVPLSRLVLTDQGDVEAVGEFTEYRLWVCGPWQLVYYDPVPWQVRFRIVGQEARAVAMQGFTPPPATDIVDLGEGYRIERFRLRCEEPAGFVHDVLPGVDVFSVFRTTDQALWAMIEGVLCRLAPDPTAGYLHISTLGNGRVVGGSGRWLPDGQEMQLKATPGSRFSQFVGWSDGNADNPRSVTLRRDATLTAQFEVRLPEPNGIDPQSPAVGPDGHFQFKVYGHHQPYEYDFQQSDNLRAWVPVDPQDVHLNGAGDIRDGFLTAADSEVWVRIIPGGAVKYFRAVMLDR